MLFVSDGFPVRPGDSAEITWNFEKFLVDKDGSAVARFPPPTTPEQVAEVLDTYR